MKQKERNNMYLNRKKNLEKMSRTIFLIRIVQISSFSISLTYGTKQRQEFNALCLFSVYQGFFDNYFFPSKGSWDYRRYASFDEDSQYLGEDVG